MGIRDRLPLVPRGFSRKRVPDLDLSAAWEANAATFIGWATAPMHDAYWRFHRDQFLSLVPPPGTLTIDVGCGEGRFARDLTRLGHHVFGVDVSPTMIAAARAASDDVEYAIADAVAMPLADRSADLAIAFMSLHDLDDLAGALREIARVLAPGGRLCMAIPHPINSAGQFDGSAPDSPFTIRGSYLDEFRYVEDIRRSGRQVRYASAHRPLQAYVDALADAGFVIERLREPAPPESENRPQWRRIPMFLHLRAMRPE